MDKFWVIPPYRGFIKEVANAFGVTEKTVYSAFRCITHSPKAKQIRKYAHENGAPYGRYAPTRRKLKERENKKDANN